MTIANISSLKEKNFTNPQFVFRNHSLQKAVGTFQKDFKAKILYAVKTNPHSQVIKSLYQQQVNAFDVASISEAKMIYEFCPNSEIFFMNPVKSRQSIRDAYFKYNIKHFSLDTSDELKKILEETNFAQDLELHVRITIPNNFAEITLAEKFGINLQDAPLLLNEVKKYAKKIGTCFHVGSQSMHQESYRIAIRIVNDVIKKADIEIDYFNVGGGFPSIYPGMTPPKLQDYFNAIHEEFAKINNYQNIQLLAEPGRALVAESMSLIVRVELRKENNLYINDGTYGNLFDAGVLNFIFPTKIICQDMIGESNVIPYSFYGPTCDSLDYMKGPFYLPENIKEGDLIEIGQMGSYAHSMATNFNGFSAEEDIIAVSDEPLMTMYSED
jgi:ornithine decarboxylase